MSVRWSIWSSRPSACSGAMYAGVPTTSPWTVNSASCISSSGANPVSAASSVEDDDLAVVAPGHRGELRRRQEGEQALHLSHGFAGKPLGSREEDGGGVESVFGLAQEVGRAHLGIGAVVGDDQDLGRAGEEVDADSAIELAFGLGDIMADVAAGDIDVDVAAQHAVLVAQHGGAC